MKKRIIEALVATTVAVAVFVACGRAEVSVNTGDKEEITDESFDSSFETDVLTEPAMIYVHVCGHVVNPGVYCLPLESRVYEAVEMAGGETGDAYLEGINLVEILSDGQKIYVPSMDDIANAFEQDDGLININTADVDLLCTIPGIGQTRAAAIISYREQYGDFANIEELMNVSGIKSGTFEKIKNYIKV